MDGQAPMVSLVKKTDELAIATDEEKPGRRLTGRTAALVNIVAVGVAVLALWQTFRPLSYGSQYYLIIFLGVTLPLIFLLYRSGLPQRDPDRPSPADWLLAALALVTCLYPVLPFGGGYNAFLDRQGELATVDTVMGTILLLLILEATRRTTGWILPFVCLIFLAYGYYGGYLPQSWEIAHAGLNFNEIVDALYNSPSGFYGTPLDVAATYIVLFTIYGAALDLAGAGKFFVDLSVAAFRRSSSAPGRTAVAAGFLLGTVSGSGAATTVSVGAVTWPILKRAGYRPEPAGGMLAAAGVGAILSPPTLGAAAFIIAEYLGVSYLSVLGWAVIPTILYYLGILLAVEIDARRSSARPVEVLTPSVWRLLARFGYHFGSLIAIVVLLALDVPATLAVVYATLLALAGWAVEVAIAAVRDRRPGAPAAHPPAAAGTAETGATAAGGGAGIRAVRAAVARAAVRRAVGDLWRALAGGVRGVLPVVAVCAAAGVIAANTTKTGLGPQAASLLVRAAEAIAADPTLVRLFTALFAAVALTLLGLAVPVTASFIIGWVIIGPALIDLGVPDPAVAMFVFYFAVLSEATPPTALASVAAAAVTGGRIVPTMWQTLRYALPAYLVPLAFVAAPTGTALIGDGTPGEIVYAVAAAAAAVVGLAVAAGGWALGIGPAGTPVRVLAAAAGCALLWITPIATAIGATLLVAALILARVGARPRQASPPGPGSE